MEKEELIIDTSSILFSLANGSDILDEIESANEYYPIISRGVILELEKFADSKTKLKPFAVVAINSIKKHKIRIDESKVYVDKWILSVSERKKYTVCTNDIKLKKELRNMGIHTLSVTKTGTLR